MTKQKGEEGLLREGAKTGNEQKNTRRGMKRRCLDKSRSITFCFLKEADFKGTHYETVL